MTTNNSLDNKSSPFDVDNIHLAANTISITNTNGTLDLNSNGTGTASLGTNATSHQTSVGSVNGTSSTTVQSGTGALNVVSTNGAVTVNSGTGALSISNDASATTVTVGTGAAVKTVTVGSATGASQTDIQSGTGHLHLTTINGDVDIRTGTGSITVSNDAADTNASFGTGNGNKTVTIGSPSSTSSTVINCGTGGCFLGATINAHDTLVGSVVAGSTLSLQAPLGKLSTSGVAGHVVSNLNVVTIDTVSGDLGSQALSGSFTWNDTTASTTISVNNGYSVSANAVVLTLPVTSAFGTTFEVSLQGGTSWQIAQNAGQSIRFGDVSTTVGTGGSLASTAQGNTLALVCDVADTHWFVKSSMGNVTIV